MKKYDFSESDYLIENGELKPLFPLNTTEDKSSALPSLPWLILLLLIIFFLFSI
jgi:hypothetical protein